jgi:fatty acid-binding protein DegV
VWHGEVTPVETMRPRERAHDRLLELVRAIKEVREAYVGQTSDALGQEMVTRLRGFYTSYLQRSWISSTVGAHVGNGVGISVVSR